MYVPKLSIWKEYAKSLQVVYYSGRFLKSGSLHTLMADIVHNPSYLEEDSVQYYKHKLKRTTNMADVHEIDGWWEKHGLLITQTGFSY